jgi:glucosamine 6-phosphate synthetase-like amidotransferase/phosphosugar isomerase protein
MTKPPYITVLEYTDIFLSVKGKNIQRNNAPENATKRVTDSTGKEAERRLEGKERQADQRERNKHKHWIDLEILDYRKTLMSKMAQVNEIIGFLLKKKLTPAGIIYIG